MIKMALMLAVVGGFLAFVEYYAIKHDDSMLRVRINWFEEHKDRVEGLIFGPSYIVRSINPAALDRPSASLALGGSGANVDAKIFAKTIKTCNPEFVIMCYTDGWLERRKDTEYFASTKLSHYFGIRYDGWRLKDAFYSSYPLYRYFTAEPQPLPFNEQGFLLEVEPEKDLFRELEYDTLRIENYPKYARFSRFSGPRNSDENNRLNRKDLKSVVDICRERNIKLIFLSPPLYYLYNEKIRPELGERGRLFLDEVVDNETVFYWDYHRFEEKSPRNFFNVNHMSPHGAKRFTAELNERLNELE